MIASALDEGVCFSGVIGFVLQRLFVETFSFFAVILAKAVTHAEHAIRYPMLNMDPRYARMTYSRDDLFRECLVASLYLKMARSCFNFDLMVFFSYNLAH